jgi:hypothetical protein
MRTLQCAKAAKAFFVFRRGFPECDPDVVVVGSELLYSSGLNLYHLWTGCNQGCFGRRSRIVTLGEPCDNVAQ